MLLNILIKMSGNKNIDLILFIVFLILTTVGVALMRSLPLHNKIIGFISDTAANIGGVLVASSLFIWLKGYRTYKLRIRVILAVCFGFIVYELIQIFLPWATFDVNDMLGTLLGALIAIGINLMVVVFCFNKR